MAADAELGAGDADDDLVLTGSTCGAGLALLRIAVDDLPHLLAGLGVERHERGVGLVQEEHAVGIGEAAVDGVAAHHRDNGRILLGLVLPDDLAVSSRSSAYTMFGNGVCTYIMLPITRAQPSWPRSTPVEKVQATFRLDVVRVDLVEWRIAGVSVVTLLHAPVIRVADTLNNAIIRQRGCREGSRRPAKHSRVRFCALRFLLSRGSCHACKRRSHRQRVTTPYFTDRVFPLFPPGLRGFPSSEGDREGAATGTHLGTFSRALQD